jgi:hypothetical protein
MSKVAHDQYKKFKTINWYSFVSFKNITTVVTSGAGTNCFLFQSTQIHPLILVVFLLLNLYLCSVL